MKDEEATAQWAAEKKRARLPVWTKVLLAIGIVLGVVRLGLVFYQGSSQSSQLAFWEMKASFCTAKDVKAEKCGPGVLTADPGPNGRIVHLTFVPEHEKFHVRCAWMAHDVKVSESIVEADAGKADVLNVVCHAPDSGNPDKLEIYVRERGENDFLESDDLGS